jgi:hypothetical protein
LALYAFNRPKKLRRPALRRPGARGGHAADCLIGRFISLFGRFSSLFDRFISRFGRLGNLPRSLQQHQWLGRVEAALEGRKIVVFPVFSQRTGKQSHVAAGPAFPKDFLIDLW